MNPMGESQNEKSSRKTRQSGQMESAPGISEIPDLETIIFRFHVKLWGCIIPKPDFFLGFWGGFPDLKTPFGVCLG